MQMRHGLAAIPAVVEDDAVAGFVETQFTGHRGGLEQQVAEQLLVFGPGVGQAGDVFLGNDEDMGWRFGIDVAEGQDQVIFEDDIGRDFAGDDFLEYILAHNWYGRR